MRRATDGASTAVPPSFTGAASASTTSTLRPQMPRSPSASSTRAPSPDPYYASSARASNEDRPRSSSFSAGGPHFRARLDSDIASSARRGLTMTGSGSPSGRATPHRSQSSRSEHGSGSPLLASPSMASLASVSTMAAPRSLYDSRQIAAAIDKFETHKLEVRSGELGAVGAVGFGGDDHWQTVCVRVLPLWNGEGARGYIEDLNDLVHMHIRRLIDRSPASAIEYLRADLQSLISTGMLTLSNRLANLDEDQLLRRLEQCWNFFFGNVLPYLEAVFLPFTTDLALMSLSAKHTPNPDSTRARSPRFAALDTRRLALISFRDHLILPHAARLARCFLTAALPNRQGAASTGGRRGSLASFASGSTALAGGGEGLSTSSSGTAWTGRKMQMLGLVASAQTGDDAQATVEALARALRGETSAFRILDPARDTVYFEHGLPTESPRPASSSDDSESEPDERGQRGSPTIRRRQEQRSAFFPAGSDHAFLRSLRDDDASE